MCGCPPEQILYTINHAEDDILLVHADFLPMLEGIKNRIERVCTIVLLSDDGRRPATTLEPVGEDQDLLAAGSPDFVFPDFDENTRATMFYTTGTTGLPKGVNFSHRQLVLHTLAVAATFGANPAQGRFHRGDDSHADNADVPRARLGFSVHRHNARREAGVSGSLYARTAGAAVHSGKGHLLALRADASPCCTCC